MYVYKQVVVNEDGKARVRERLTNAGRELKNATVPGDIGARAAAGAALGGLGNMAVGTVKHRVELRKLKKSGATDATIEAYKRLAHRDTIRRGLGGAAKGAAVGAASHYAPAVVKSVRGQPRVQLADRDSGDASNTVSEAVSPELKTGLAYAGVGAASSQAARMLARHRFKKNTMKQYESMNLSKEQRAELDKQLNKTLKAHRRKDLAHALVKGAAAGATAWGGAMGARAIRSKEEQP